MTKYRLTIIIDPDGMYGDYNVDFVASSDKTAKIYAKGKMTENASSGDSIGHLKRYNSRTGRYRRIGVFTPTFIDGYAFYPERK